MSKPKKTELEIQTEIWYKKLKDEGFVDIEHGDGSINSSVPSTLRPVGMSSKASDIDITLKYDSTLGYYCMTTHFLNDYKFKKERDRMIWEYYANGLSYLDIVSVLKKIGVKTSRTRVGVTIKRLEKIMKDMYLST